MKMRKAGCLWSLVRLVIVLVALVFAGFYFFGGSIISTGISTFGRLVGVEMSAGSVSLNLTNQSISIKNFQIKNPEGYTPGDAVSFGEIFIDLDLNFDAIKGLKPIVIEKILIDKAFISIEYAKGVNSFASILGAATQTNLTDISNKFKSLSSGSSSPASTKDSSSEPRKYILHSLEFKDAKVQFGLFGKNLGTVDLLGFQANDIGVKENGVTMGALVYDVSTVIVDHAMQSVGKALPSIKLNDGDKKEDSPLGILKGIF